MRKAGPAISAGIARSKILNTIECPLAAQRPPFEDALIDDRDPRISIRLCERRLIGDERGQTRRRFGAQTKRHHARDRMTDECRRKTVVTPSDLVANSAHAREREFERKGHLGDLWIHTVSRQVEQIDAEGCRHSPREVEEAVGRESGTVAEHERIPLSDAPNPDDAVVRRRLIRSHANDDLFHAKR